MSWTSTSPQLFFSRNDASDPRLGELVTTEANLPQGLEPVWIWGYQDDEGIDLNGGRVGARFAPPQIRKPLYKMTPLLDFRQGRRCVDLGDLLPGELSIAERHEEGRKLARAHFAKPGFCLSFGAGHDYAFADGAGFIEATRAEGLKPVVLNFDAHMDVRPADKGLNSGTAFRRLLDTFPGEYDFFEIGLQPQCNSEAHARWVESKGGTLVWLKQLRREGAAAIAAKILAKLKPGQPLWISLDIDAFPNTHAPGCSQAWDLGVSPEDFFTLCTELQKKLSLRGLSIYEVSPPLDVDHRTSKLAALIAYHFIHAFDRNGGPREGIW